MYFFVRSIGIVKIIFGILLMLAGIAAIVYGFLQNAVVVDYVNRVWLSSGNTRLVDARFYSSLVGLGMFVAGMFATALGQLLLVFADTAAGVRETNKILHSMRRPERPAS